MQQESSLWYMVMTFNAFKWFFVPLCAKKNTANIHLVKFGLNSFVLFAGELLGWYWDLNRDSVNLHSTKCVA